MRRVHAISEGRYSLLYFSEVFLLESRMMVVRAGRRIKILCLFFVSHFGLGG